MEAEPSPRWGHYSTLVEEKLYVQGGRTKDFPGAKGWMSLHSFDPFLEFWSAETIKCSGFHPSDSVLVPAHLKVTISTYL
jgi:hypothetical protein